MTSATKRKHVVKEMLEDFSIPGKEQQIVKVLGNPGSNLHEVITKDGDKFLCSLPVKFRKNIWIKRGDFVVIEPIKEGDKVKAEIVRILYPQHVKSLQSSGNWPAQFNGHCNKPNTGKPTATLENAGLPDTIGLYHEILLPNVSKNVESDNSDCHSSDEDDLEDIPANTNRPPVYYEEDSTSDSEDDW